MPGLPGEVREHERSEGEGGGAVVNECHQRSRAGQPPPFADQQGGTHCQAQAAGVTGDVAVKPCVCLIDCLLHPFHQSQDDAPRSAHHVAPIPRPAR